LNINFKEEGHIYYLDGGEILPSVSQILQDCGIIDTTYFKPGHATRGREIHKATEFIDNKILDISCYSESEHIKYIEAYELFKKETGFEVLEVEKKVYSEIYKYAGTIDRIGILNEKKIILDIKSGVKQGWHGIQLTAYNLSQEFIYNIYGLYLNKHGTYVLEKYNSAKYMDTFLSALNVYRFKHERIQYMDKINNDE